MTHFPLWEVLSPPLPGTAQRTWPTHVAVTKWLMHEIRNSPQSIECFEMISAIINAFYSQQATLKPARATKYKICCLLCAQELR